MGIDLHAIIFHPIMRTSLCLFLWFTLYHFLSFYGSCSVSFYCLCFISASFYCSCFISASFYCSCFISASFYSPRSISVSFYGSCSTSTVPLNAISLFFLTIMPHFFLLLWFLLMLYLYSFSS